MKRWDTSTDMDVEDDKVDCFLAEIVEICTRYGYALGHEDQHGTFIVKKSPDSSWNKWLMDAAVQSGEI